MMVRALVVGAMLGSAAAVVSAQEANLPALAAPMERLTLEDAVARGIANSQRLAELEARQQGAEAAEAGQQAAERPLRAAGIRGEISLLGW